MFTGIVQVQGEVSKKTTTRHGESLEITVPKSFKRGLIRGASVSVNGVCLTVIKHEKEKLTFDVIKETLRTTNLSDVKKTSKVNIERSLKVGDEVGGHVLSGHICCACKATVETKDGEVEIVVDKPRGWGEHITPKGYVALNGVSLTVGKVTEKNFSTFLIPETIESTNLLSVKKGATLNLEIDQKKVL